MPIKITEASPAPCRCRFSLGASLEGGGVSQGNRPNTVSESTVSNTELGGFFFVLAECWGELSEFLSAYYLHHPSGVGIDGVVKIFRLNYFSVMCCRKFVLRNVTLGPLFQKRNQARQ